MDKFKTLIRNKLVIRSLIVVGLTTAGAATLPDEQIDKLADVVVMLLSILL
jgi:hypothetical protein